MDELVVLPSALKHGLDAGQIEGAWENFVARRPRGDGVAVAIGSRATSRSRWRGCSPQTAGRS